MSDSNGLICIEQPEGGRGGDVTLYATGGFALPLDREVRPGRGAKPHLDGWLRFCRADGHATGITGA